MVGIDNLNSYYDPALKTSRLKRFDQNPEFKFLKVDIADRKSIDHIFSSHSFDFVINLAAQVGVRYSLENPHAYVESNVTGFLNILEGCRQFGVRKLLFASSSSVYGNSTELPLKLSLNTDHPISIYAATKKSNELMAYTYSSLFGIEAAGLRFFTVYGPWGRPDMAVYKFTKNIIEGKPIDIFNQGKHSRDMTYVDDVVESLMKLISKRSHDLPNDQKFKIYNVGNESPVELMKLIEVIEASVGKKAIKNLIEASPGDVDRTLADSSELYKDTGYKPKTLIENGIRDFVDWYRSYYQLREK